MWLRVMVIALWATRTAESRWGAERGFVSAVSQGCRNGRLDGASRLQFVEPVFADFYVDDERDAEFHRADHFAAGLVVLTVIFLRWVQDPLLR
jgi:hypothetical protein